MTTQQLECFIRVADKLNFTKAAQEMFLTTPTVTHHIKSLEEELGATLFIRTPKWYSLPMPVLNSMEMQRISLIELIFQARRLPMWYPSHCPI